MKPQALQASKPQGEKPTVRRCEVCHAKLCRPKRFTRCSRCTV
jgi:hypothetical protein